MKNRKSVRKMIFSITVAIGVCAMASIPVWADSIGWTKVDGVFVNPLGEEIEGAVLKGIDVSYHNKDIDWQAVKDSDIDYVIIRCGYGQNFESQDDVKWQEYADACTELGIPFGTYLYSYATTVSAAKSEAEHVLRVIEGYQLTYPVYYDMEDSKQAPTSARRKAQMAEVFCSTIEAAGYQVGIYANTDWFTTKLTDSYFDSRDKWVAQYNNACAYAGDYRMWQCTSSGTVPGISTKADLNFWFDEPPVYQGNTPPASSENNGTGEAAGTEGNEGIGNGTGIENNGSENNGVSGENNTPENNSPENNGSSGESNTPENSGTETDSNIHTDGENNQGTDGSTTDIQNPETNDNSNSGNNTEDPEIPKKLTLSQDMLTLSYGGTSVLTASQEVLWSSSDKTVVKVNSKGKVTPAGTGEAVIMAEASSGETAECYVTVKKRIKDTEISEIPDQQFTGKQIRPAIIVMDGEKTLVKGTDYKVVYADNMAKGTASVTVQGKGYYKGKTVINFQIVPKEKPAAPVVSSISSENRSIVLKWKKVSKASGYEIYRAASKNGVYTLKKTMTENTKVTYKDKKLTTGKKYYYKIRAYQLVNGKKQYSSYTKVNIRA